MQNPDVDELDCQDFAVFTGAQINRFGNLIG
jgi:hypothetical protein